MPATILLRPSADEHAPYFATYISMVPAGDLVSVYRTQLDSLPALLAGIGDARAGYRYAPDKWSVREVVGHLIDTERVFSYRATQFSRGDSSPLPSFDQDAWVPHGHYDSRALEDLIEEWRDVRRASLSLVRGLPSEALARRGIASNMSFSVLALVCIIPGHVAYHVTRLPTDYAAAWR